MTKHYVRQIAKGPQGHVEREKCYHCGVRLAHPNPEECPECGEYVRFVPPAKRKNWRGKVDPKAEAA